MEPKSVSGSEALASAWILSLSRESEDIFCPHLGPPDWRECSQYWGWFGKISYQEPDTRSFISGGWEKQLWMTLFRSRVWSPQGQSLGMLNPGSEFVSPRPWGVVSGTGGEEVRAV